LIVTRDAEIQRASVANVVCSIVGSVKGTDAGALHMDLARAAVKPEAV